MTKKNQDHIVDQLITTLLNQSTRRIKITDLAYLAEEIVKLFPTEVISTYYIPAVKKNESRKNISMPARGKLVNKYKNMLNELRNLNESLPNDQDTENESDAHEDAKASKIWLGEHISPWNIVLQHWTVSFPLRRQEALAAGSVDIAQFFNQWMPLKHPNGYELINEDFLSIGLTKKIVNVKYWDFFFKVISSECELPVKDFTGLKLQSYLSEENQENLNEDSKTAIQLLLLPHFIPPQNFLKSCKKKSWKPSIANAKDSLLLHVKLSSDVTNTRDERTKYLKAQGLSFQPQIIVVGSEITKITESYVCFDNLIYKVNSTFQAIDLCFKVFHVINAEYSLESEHLWLLIQKGLYNFSTRWDKTISYTARVLKVINDRIKERLSPENEDRDQVHDESGADKN